MLKETIRIKGMSCQHCVMTIKKAVATLDGIAEADVEIGKATVTFDESKLRKSDIEAAIETAGYEVEKGSG